MVGLQIKKLEHAKIWCIDNHLPVIIISKKGVQEEHSYKVIKNMPFNALIKMINYGRLFELHQPKNN